MPFKKLAVAPPSAVQTRTVVYLAALPAGTKVSAGKIRLLLTFTVTGAPLVPAVPPALLNAGALPGVPPVVAAMLAVSLARLPVPQDLVVCNVAVFTVLV